MPCTEGGPGSHAARRTREKRRWPASPVEAQYSSGSNTVVRSLDASVMTYSRCPLPL